VLHLVVYTHKTAGPVVQYLTNPLEQWGRDEQIRVVLRLWWLARSEDEAVDVGATVHSASD
jgi:hypothetical protein